MVKDIISPCFCKVRNRESGENREKLLPAP
jgi:hypothetical protein